MRPKVLLRQQTSVSRDIIASALLHRELLQRNQQIMVHVPEAITVLEVLRGLSLVLLVHTQALLKPYL